MLCARRMYRPIALAACLGFAFSGGAWATEEKKEKPKPIANYTMAILPPADADNITPSEIYIDVTHFTTDQERAALLTLVKEKGQSAALSAAQDKPVGTLRRAGGLGYDILYAFKQTSADGDRIVVATLRFPVYQGAVMNADPMLMPFTLASFVPTPDGKGKGKIYGAVALQFDKDGKLDMSAYPASAADLAFARIK